MQRGKIEKIIISSVALIFCFACPTFATTDYGMPFGDITNDSIEEFGTFAKANGLDVISEMENVYRNKDTAALGRVFQFSTKLSDFDIHARTYGQIIFSSLLNLGEAWGKDDNPYFEVLNSQTPEVQQRIRDFLYYPLTFVPLKEKEQAVKEARKSTILFQTDYVFGKGNSIFRNISTETQ